MRVFLDTNILVYAIDPAEPEKRQRAREVIAEHADSGQLVLSTQVLSEFYNIATRKIGVPPDLALALVERHAEHEVIESSVALVVSAIRLHQEHSLSFWDAQIIRAAQFGECDLLISEDLQHGRLFAELTINNPF